VSIERVQERAFGNAGAVSGEIPGLRYGVGALLTVVFTTEAGTTAALKTAGELARELNARILLGIPEIVPPQYPLERPLVPVELLERRALRLLAAAGIQEEKAAVEIWLCRERKKCLQHVLRPHSLVVIGGKWRWWRRDEWKLEKWLSGRGHHVIFAGIKASICAEMVPKAYGDLVITHVMNMDAEKARGARRK
jgi:hypothetical protein